MPDFKWIDGVLKDLEEFAAINKLPKMQKKVSQTRAIANAEIGDLESSSQHASIDSEDLQNSTVVPFFGRVR